MGNNNVGKWVVNLEQFMILCCMYNEMIRENFTENVPFRQKAGGDKGASHVGM